MNPVTNLDQVRASFAVRYKDARIGGKDGGQVVKKIPHFIRHNGLLATAAFAAEKDEKGGLENKGFHDVFALIIEYLADGAKKLDRRLSVDQFVEHASACSSAELRTLTDETMAYLAYLRRFVTKGSKDQEHAH